MSAIETQPATRSSRVIRFFANDAEQEAETFRYWGSRTVDERLQALAELLRSPRPVTLGEDEGEAVRHPRVVRLFKDREEQEAWNRLRALDGTRP